MSTETEQYIRSWVESRRKMALGRVGKLHERLVKGDQDAASALEWQAELTLVGAVWLVELGHFVNATAADNPKRVDVEQYLHRLNKDILNAARYPSRSTSVLANLRHQIELSVRAEMVVELGELLREGE